MKFIGAFCILFSAVLWILGICRAGRRKLAIYRESVEFLEFVRNKILLAAMPIPEIREEYRIAHPESLLFPHTADSPLSDYLRGAGESGMEGELRRMDYHLFRLSETIKTMEEDISGKNRLIPPVFLSTALILVLILL